MDKRPRESLKMDVLPPFFQARISRLPPSWRGPTEAVQGQCCGSVRYIRIAPLFCPDLEFECGQSICFTSR